MIHFKLFAFTALSVAVLSCEKDKNELKNNFSIDTSHLKQVYSLNESINLQVKNAKNLPVDSIQYFLGDTKIGSATGNSLFPFALRETKLGSHTIKATVYTEGTTVDEETKITLASSIQPKLLNYKIVNTYPHDIKAYTQGFEFYRDTLFEGTGNGRGSGTGTRDVSSLRKTDYRTGEVFKKITLEDQYFGEGITVLNNKVYQLTWLNKEGYVYDADTFKKIKTFKYFKDIEGWGLTNDGKKLYMSDGSEKIYVLDPETMQEVDYINVYTQHAKIESLNELEWIDGKIWANIYGKDAIGVINTDGEVEAILNLGDLRNKVTQHPDIDVLNGIAYNPKTKTIFVTGKNWDKTFELLIEE
ncbi:glutamine cyclotransferase [Flavobacterium sediminis]|uniref:Glutamine cyclotransferase n=1 Tax=Flavobacterium sediminis TaxID=2201181 RepID=A0A2U8QRL6_9FLAO|nr:glutaminyl-peptide cyclotransferase [Flavobacterium sediminis]AWM12496.1 glutamine cyclotransferase [Flavobacterium sediminis]